MARSATGGRTVCAGSACRRTNRRRPHQPRRKPRRTTRAPRGRWPTSWDRSKRASSCRTRSLYYGYCHVSRSSQPGATRPCSSVNSLTVFATRPGKTEKARVGTPPPVGYLKPSNHRDFDGFPAAFRTPAEAGAPLAPDSRAETDPRPKTKDPAPAARARTRVFERRSASEWGCPPPLVAEIAGDQLRRGLAVARMER